MHYNVDVTLISPENLRLSDYVYNELKNKLNITISDSLEKYINDTDVLYVTRLQKERFTDKNEYSKLIGSYRITAKETEKMKNNSIIMHPLPRVDEISPEVDSTDKAKYFKAFPAGI